MRQTALFSEHQTAGAQMAAFAGWQMPMHYGSSVAEHEAVRQSAGMFDVSHMTVCDVIGDDAIAFCQQLLAGDVGRCVAGQALYSCMLNDEGGVIDDLIAYRMADNHIRLILNAGTFEQDMAWLRGHAATFAVTLHLPEGLALLAVQGPEAIDKLKAHLPKALAEPLSQLRPFRSISADGWQLATTGYTGEAGVELVLPANAAVVLWQRLHEAGVMPCGLVARDSLRLESGYALYGQDLDVKHTPLASALAWTVAWDPERDFIGREALLAQKTAGISEHLVGVVLKQRGVLRHGQGLQHDGKPVGEITSGGFSPTLSMGIGLARLSRVVKVGGTVQCMLRGKMVDLFVVKPPFVKCGRINF